MRIKGQLMRKISVPVYLIYTLLIFCPHLLLAEVRVTKLYEAEIEVQGQGIEHRQEAIKTGLLEVLTKVSGKQNLQHETAISDALSSLSRYVERTRYRQVSILEGAKLVMWIQYNPTMVNQLLAQADLPVWDSKRPTTLIWLAVEDGANRYILGSSEASAEQAQIKAVFKKMAKKRGIPVMFPIMDLEDQTRIRYTDISAGFVDAVRRASKRYSTDAILLGSIRRMGDQWKGRWTLLESENTQNYQAGLQNMDSLLGSGVNGLANYLSNVIMDSSPLVDFQDEDASKLKVAVANITSVDAYAKMLKEISSLNVVKQAEVLGVFDSLILFSIELKPDSGSFRQAAASISTLKPIRNSGISNAPVPSDSNIINYRYTP